MRGRARPGPAPEKRPVSIFRRVRRLARETWWLLLIVVVAAVLFGLLLNPILGLVVPVVVLPVYVYFAIVRYDAAGEERPDRQH